MYDEDEDHYPDASIEPGERMNHVAGPYNEEECIQRCVICGGILSNSTRRWPEGSVYRLADLLFEGENSSLPQCSAL